jgi:urea transport system permease protein
MTDLRTLLGWDIRTDEAKETLYFVNGALLFACLFAAQFIKRSKAGRVLIATRDREERVRFSGYDVASFKIFVFCVGAAFAAIGGAMFTLQVGFMSPTLIGIVPSIEMVIFCAVGGRHSILGAVYGALLVNWAKTTFSETFPEVWLLGFGALFIAVVLAFPNGLAGLYEDWVKRPILALATRRPKAPAGAPETVAPKAGTANPARPSGDMATGPAE